MARVLTANPRKCTNTIRDVDLHLFLSATLSRYIHWLREPIALSYAHLQVLRQWHCTSRQNYISTSSFFLPTEIGSPVVCLLYKAARMLFLPHSRQCTFYTLGDHLITDALSPAASSPTQSDAACSA